MQTISHIQTYPRRPSKAVEYKYSMNATELSMWKRGAEISLRNNPGWRKYDGVISDIAATYNRHFQGDGVCSPGLFVVPFVDPKLLRAIVYTETGPGVKQEAWEKRPMQIGNAGDLGINDVLATDNFIGENAKLILPDAYKYLTFENIRNQAKENIIAGTAYLLMRACTFATVTLIDDGNPSEISVTKDLSNLERIAKAVETTVEVLLKLNPGINPNSLRPGQKLLYIKAKKKRVIYSMERLDFNFTASVYNVSGDSAYKDKLEFFYNFPD
ncbi:LysM peptidoglycan-binding domain-containing protein [Pseudomonas mangiferae]|uniref:LysM peptidoglycan-binding domain-containing protein n=1 Tax=Pseudomonas mangiferae TaxID=2593654 RepID=A0A553H4H6_9PSED|nr:LysM domain-containing protein [Pseudomonas mangiferae]TRX76669.1 LysM peptidoglycan-binding domain-containing protein [Pseudomonas mangiferae]